jgi:DNA polymerase III subunit gamma/tau
MTHQALARKWRPRDFPSVIGQDHVVKALVHALDHQRLHHAYLLTGTRGVGKTTLARILAKAVNCEVGVSSTPCGLCSACTGIDTGRYPDYMELDAASNRSVDEMTQVLETAVYSPSMGRYKVYVIDEVHMLSNHAFNAMLKTLEEPPAHVLFVLATTDPQKVPVTVLSRCLQLGLKNMTASAISGHLAEILGRESIHFEEQALAWIGKAARGSMRDALSLTDQAVTYASGQVLDAPTREMLGIVGADQVLAIFDALAEDDAAALLQVADLMLAQAASFHQALLQIAERCQSLGWMQKGIQPPEPDAQMAKDAERFDALDLQVFYQIAVQGARDLGLAPDPYTGFTMSLLRLMAFTSSAQAQGSVASASDASSAGPRRPFTARPSSPSPAARPNSASEFASATLKKPAQPLVVKPASQVSLRPEARTQELVTAEPVTLADGVFEAEASTLIELETSVVAPLRVGHEDIDPVGFDGDWPALAATLSLGGVPRMFAQQSQLLRHQRDQHGFIFHLRVGVKLLSDPAQVAKVREALQEKLGCAVQLKVELGEVQGDTAESLARQASDEKIAQTQASLENLTMVKSLIDHFDGKIIPGTVKPA